MIDSPWVGRLGRSLYVGWVDVSLPMSVAVGRSLCVCRCGFVDLCRSGCCRSVTVGRCQSLWVGIREQIQMKNRENFCH